VYGWFTQPGEMASGRAYQDWLLGDRMVAGLVESLADEPPHWRSTVEVADLDEVRERWLDGAGRVELEPIEVSVGRYARLVDPYGAPLGVIELIPELRGLR
jgi:predicted enzyme related to lactoylglutathione lyase